MKREPKKEELNVDFIGEQNQPLTQEEQLEISAFIQKLKANRKPVSKSKIKKDEKQFV